MSVSDVLVVCCIFMLGINTFILMRRDTTVMRIFEMAAEFIRWYDEEEKSQDKIQEINETLYRATMYISRLEAELADAQQRVKTEYWIGVRDIVTYNARLPEGYALWINNKDKVVGGYQERNGEWREVAFWDPKEKTLVEYPPNKKQQNQNQKDRQEQWTN